LHVILLDAEYELRRFPFASESPAFLLPVVHRSLLLRTLEWLSAAGLGKVHLVTRRNPAEDFDVARAVVENGIRIAPDVQSVLHRARKEGNLDDALLVVQGNLHPLPRLNVLAMEHRRSGRAVSFMKGSCQFGIGQYTFGPPAVVLGSPVMSRVLFQREVERPLVEIPKVAREKGLAAAPIEPEDPVVEINNPYSLFHANVGSLRNWRERLGRQGLTEIRPNLWAASGARVEKVDMDPAAGPVVIGRSTVVEEGTWLHGPTVIGHGVTVEKRSCVHHGLLLDSTFLARESFVARSVVSPRLQQSVAV
jgi:NDP-sugar pyrophosphorylase family protein